jgi:superoxide dismutase, Fe-Mn family
MEYKAKDYGHLIGMKGFSDQLLQNHFTLYNGYVTNSNKLLAELQKMLAEGKTADASFAELHRRFGWEWNGMRLHEHYFDGLGKPGPKPGKHLTEQMTKDFGSFDSWQKDFKAIGTMRGIGWVVLYFDPVAKRLMNAWINEHDSGHLAGGIPILVMDVFEHAFMIDYNLKRADYIEAYFQNIDWDRVSKNLA